MAEEGYYLTERDVRRLRGVLDWLDANGGSLGWTHRRRTLSPMASYGGIRGGSATVGTSTGWRNVTVTGPSTAANYVCSNSTADVIPNSTAGKLTLTYRGVYRVRGELSADLTTIPSSLSGRTFFLPMLVRLANQGSSQIGEEFESHVATSSNIKYQGYAGATAYVESTGGTQVYAQVRGPVTATHLSLLAERV
jgi:hypothetical protein